MTTITGNTFPVKEELKKLGGKWNPTAKGWDVPDNKADAARAIVAAASPTKSFPVRSRGGNTRLRLGVSGPEMGNAGPCLSGTT